MLHYFAKKFFSATILSASIEHSNVSLYYINDNASWQDREFHGQLTQHRDFGGKPPHDRELRQLSSSMNDMLLNPSRFVSQLNVSTHNAEDWLNYQSKPSVTDISDGNSGDVVSDMAVNVQRAINNFEELHCAQQNCIIQMQCFHWNSFEPSAEWNVTFCQVSMPSVFR